MNKGKVLKMEDKFRKWNFVGNELPSFMEVIIVYHEFKGTMAVNVGFNRNGDWFDLYVQPMKVTHWMCLPDPPKGFPLGDFNSIQG